MLRKLITLFKLGRKIAKSDILDIASKFKKPPVAITILFQLLAISFEKKELSNHAQDDGERLSKSLESMGTTFIKLGQFLATRPDIIGEELSTKLEKLQDRVPPFSINQAKEIIKNDLGNDAYNSIIDLSEPVAAASIAQVHKAKINDNGTIKDVAIKIIRPDIKKIFNEEIDAMMLFAFIIESFLKKTKRLKLVEVVFLLKEITNLEMDLRFEAAAANEYAENTKNDSPGLPRILIVSHTLNYGLKRSVWTAVGNISANFLQGFAMVFLIGTFLKDNPQILNLLKWAGILFTVYLAYDTFTAKIKSVEQGATTERSTFAFYRDGFLVAGLSPKAVIFFGTIFLSFIDFQANYVSHFIILIITYVILDFSTLMIYGLAAEKISVYLKSKPKLINTISACVLLAIAIYIAATQHY